MDSCNLNKIQVKINLGIAENILKALKRRESIDGKPYCPCRPQSKSDDDICPCVNMRTNNECCCGLFLFKGGDEVC